MGFHFLKPPLLVINLRTVPYSYTGMLVVYFPNAPKTCLMYFCLIISLFVKEMIWILFWAQAYEFCHSKKPLGILYVISFVMGSLPYTMYIWIFYFFFLLFIQIKWRAQSLGSSIYPWEYWACGKQNPSNLLGSENECLAYWASLIPYKRCKEERILKRILFFQRKKKEGEKKKDIIFWTDRLLPSVLSTEFVTLLKSTPWKILLMFCSCHAV